MNTILIRSAIEYAAWAHGSIDQRRKYTDDPYIVHPVAVGRLLASLEQDDEVIVAGLLHDTVEDTPVTLAQIEETFGARVADLVNWVTDVSRPNDGNREARKALDRCHVAQAPAEAQTIKLADLIDNTKSIVRHDVDFARVYLAEKLLLLEVLSRGNPRLLHYAKWLARQSSNYLDSRDLQIMN